MKRPDAAIVFAGLALLFGSLFVFLIPPFQSPDEPNHFLRAYQVSEGAFFPEKQVQRLGGDLPSSLVQVCDSFSFLKMNDRARLDKSLIMRCLVIPLAPGHRRFADFPNTAIYAPTAYLPQAAAIGVLRLFHATPLQMLYAARWSNLLIWVLLVFAAIRSAPFLQYPTAALALLPASLVIAASANADVVTNGLCWWLTASFLRSAAALKSDGAFSWRNSLLLKQLFAFVAVCANKLIAWPLVLPALLERDRRRRMFAGGVAVAGLVTALVWGSFAHARFIPYDAYDPALRNAQTLNEGVDPGRQWAFITTHPLFFVKTAIKSTVGAAPSAAAHLVGKFGWEKNYLHPVWLALLWLALGATVMTTDNPLAARQRLLMAGVGVLYLGLFVITMYLLWCPVGAGEVTNFQGRYFVPVALSLAAAAASGWFARFRKIARPAALLILIAGNLAMAAAIVQRF